jgi:hypothetical protein
MPSRFRDSIMHRTYSPAVAWLEKRHTMLSKHEPGHILCEPSCSYSKRVDVCAYLILPTEENKALETLSQHSREAQNNDRPGRASQLLVSEHVATQSSLGVSFKGLRIDSLPSSGTSSGSLCTTTCEREFLIVRAHAIFRKISNSILRIRGPFQCSTHAHAEKYVLHSISHGDAGSNVGSNIALRLSPERGGKKMPQFVTNSPLHVNYLIHQFARVVRWLVAHL